MERRRKTKLFRIFCLPCRQTKIKTIS